MTKMKLGLLVLLLYVLPLCGQLRKNTLHVTEEKGGRLSISVGSYLPLRDTVNYLNQEFGWNVSYEDPLYPDSELSDISVPDWRKAHPGERGFYLPRFTDMRFVIDKPKGVEGERKKILMEILQQSNQSSRQERFSLVESSTGRQVIVGRVNGRGVLDRAVLKPEPKPRNGSEELRAFSQQCSAQMPYPIVVGTVSLNMLQRITVPPRKATVSCRDALLALIDLGGPDVLYQLNEDTNGGTFVVNIVSNRSFQPSPQSK